MTADAGREGVPGAGRVEAVFFDLYGTLVDLAPLGDACESIAPGRGDELAARWRTRQLEATWLRTCMEAWAPFDVVTREALAVAARELALPVPPEPFAVDAFTSLSARAGIEAAIGRLGAAGLALGVLSNGSGAMIERTLSQAGLVDQFGHRLSVDEVGAYKPAPAVYRLACDATGLAPRQIGFVTANGWDAAGAAVFGFDVAWLRPPGAHLPAVGSLPAEAMETDVERLAGRFGA